MKQRESLEDRDPPSELAVIVRFYDTPLCSPFFISMILSCPARPRPGWCLTRAIGRPENSGGGGNSHVLCIICFPNRNRVNVLDMISVEGYHPPPPFSDGLSLRINVNVRHLSTMLFEIAVQYRVVCNLWVWYLLRIGLHLHFWS